MSATSLRTDEHADPSLGAARYVVFGMGATGCSCARFLSARGALVRMVDTRSAPPLLGALRAALPDIDCHCGRIPSDVLGDADVLVVSPGVSLDHPLIMAARTAGLPVLGDIDLFARYARAPYVAITGSNGKSTVTTLVADILAASGRTVRAGANLGTPALDLLSPTEPDIHVLELSSFQLELARCLAPAVACVLNVSADHLDRHGTLEHYAAVKSRILRGARRAVLNRDDPRVRAMVQPDLQVEWVTLGAPAGAEEYGVLERDGCRWLARGDEYLLRTSELFIQGRHNEINALAALAITDVLGVSRDGQRRVLREFPGLDHRCRLVAEHDGISWFNDSKGTNIGASSAAIAGIFTGRSGVLIAGGQGKGADFQELRPALAGRVHAVVLLGEDASRIEAAISDLVTTRRVGGMREAVEIARTLARAGDAVLLSPACASLDMFENYAARGRAFEDAVREVLQPR
jgi:UDP-N-acetylmuramoylalanine--D-glutamate ligase